MLDACRTTLVSSDAPGCHCSSGCEKTIAISAIPLEKGSRMDSKNRNCVVKVCSGWPRLAVGNRPIASCQLPLSIQNKASVEGRCSLDECDS